MTRTFDPRFAAALRTELEQRADAVASSPEPARRRQWPVVGITAVAVAAVVLLAGVLPFGGHRAPAPGSSASGPVDPRTEITDPGSGDLFVAPTVLALLERRGVSSGRFRFEVPPGVTSVRVYLTCAGTGDFGIAVGDDSTEAACAPRIHGYPDVPVRTGAHTVAISVDQDTRWSLLVIPTPDGTTTYSTLVVTQSPPSTVVTGRPHVRPPHDS